MDDQTLDQYIDRLQTAVSTAMRKIGSDLSELQGLTGPQFFIMNLLYKNGKYTVTELADKISVKPSAVTVMIDRLYKNGYVLRERDEHDRRVVILQLSDAGRLLFEQALEKRKKVLRQYMAYMDQEELEFLVKIYEKFALVVEKVHGENHAHQQNE